jgi:hypothetical protein
MVACVLWEHEVQFDSGVPDQNKEDIMKCENCEQSFSLEQKGSGGHNRIFCYECMPANPLRIIRNKQRSKLLRDYSDKLKKERGCDECGYKKCARALEWHHTESKKENPANLLNHSLQKYLTEIKKCQLLCSNCHRELHDNETMGV